MSNIKIDKNTYEVTVDGVKHNPSKRRFDLIFFLALNKGKYFSRDHLLNSVWETEFLAPRTVDALASRCKKILGSSLESKINIGYRISPDAKIEIIKESTSFEKEKEEKQLRGSDNKKTNPSGILVNHLYKSSDGTVTVMALAKCREYGDMVVYLVGSKWHVKPVKEFKTEFVSIG